MPLVQDASPVVLPFSMPYGELEQMIAGLVGATPHVVRSRFRKLRLRPFPDDIQSGTGNRVRFDLRRIIAITAVFELNNLSIPQGHAIDMVKASWPECCRAMLAAAAETELISIESMPVTTGPILAIGCGAIGNKDAMIIDAVAVHDFDFIALALRPAIATDARRVLASVAAWASCQGDELVTALKRALNALAQDYGWQRPLIEDGEFRLPSPLLEKSFLLDGPYFQRALEFLKSGRVDNESRRPAARYRLQWLYDYLEDPAPVDAFKGEIGRVKGEARLRHHLNFYAREIGLKTRELYPTSWNFDDARLSALGLLDGVRP